MQHAGQRSTRKRTELAEALSSCRGAFVSIGLMSGMTNILMLTGSFFMLEIYDRVLPSRSMPTLFGLAILACSLYVVLGLLDLIRSRIVARIGQALDELLSGRVYETLVRLPLKLGNCNEGLQPLRDLDNIRSFLSGIGPIALFDLPWLPIYLVICFMFHPYIGLSALAGAIILGVLALFTEIMTRAPSREAVESAITRSALAEVSRRNAETLTALGMSQQFAALWRDANADYMNSQRRASDVTGGFGAMSKVFRLMVQSGVLAVGAYLVINQQATAGIIIAGSILSARALAPVDLAITNWRSFMNSRQSWYRLSKLLELLPPESEPTTLPAPTKSLAIENVSIVPPGSNRVVAQEISFSLNAGTALGIIGPSGSGKSSLARALVGVWQPAHGRVKIDGAALDQWSPSALGLQIGYLPQNVELFAGTVAQNIGRFQSNAQDETIVAAAKAAGAHDLIVSLPGGYDTAVGEGGSSLSAGQAQRIALARALYQSPFLVVLDEPNSNLDADGDEALTQAIAGVRARGGIAIVIAHRPAAVVAVDMLMMISQGRVQAFGPKEDVLARVVQRTQGAIVRPLRDVNEVASAMR
jgi:ATP-binding cassette subfamily C protein PrsD